MLEYFLELDVLIIRLREQTMALKVNEAPEIALKEIKLAKTSHGCLRFWSLPLMILSFGTLGDSCNGVLTNHCRSMDHNEKKNLRIITNRIKSLIITDNLTDEEKQETIHRQVELTKHHLDCARYLKMEKCYLEAIDKAYEYIQNKLDEDDNSLHFDFSY